MELLLIEQIGWAFAFICIFIIVYLKWIQPLVVARQKCHVCGFSIGKKRRVLAEDEFYHYDCWLKMYKREILD